MRPAAWILFAALSVSLRAQSVPFDDTKGREGEWGFRPQDDRHVDNDPPAFVWRPQKNAKGYRLQVAHDDGFDAPALDVETASDWPVHCPPTPFGVGAWSWRVRFRGKDDTWSEWSRTRWFTIADAAAHFALPAREEVLARIPAAHPRLFVRPEDREALRTAAHSTLQGEYAALILKCEALLAKPVSIEEPPRYPKDVGRKSEAWREIWWGNRTRTIAVLESAATLAFVHWIDGEPRYAAEAKRLLLGAAQWDPKGATSFRYNDEAGMPYACHFARTYSFLHDELGDDERALCRRVLLVRGRELFAHLCPNHFWKPFDSHANRAWHFLGEVGIALHGEEAEADEWTWFALSVFGAVYPVWSDEDGGWHEGLAYWRSYLSRFTWWADVMRSAMDIDAFQKPFFAHSGDYALYLQPPGTRGGGFGDLCTNLVSSGNVDLMRTFASASGNGTWQWYVDQHPEVAADSGYIGFLRAAREPAVARPPDDLPTAKLFAGTGLAAMNTTLSGAANNVELLFKSSPFGSQSHGYDAQNSFLLYAYGECLLLPSGYRDIHGSEHHSKWMWSTRSENDITVGGHGQIPHSREATGKITAFATSPRLDLVEGEAASAYGGLLDRCTRTVVFARPRTVIVFDRLRARKPTTFEWWLHAETPFDLSQANTAGVESGKAACEVRWLAPEGLHITQTDRFDPPPRPRVKLVQHHLTASTTEERTGVEFVTCIDIHPAGAHGRAAPEFGRTATGYRLRAVTGGEVLVVDLPIDGEVGARLEDGDGRVLVRVGAVR